MLILLFILIIFGNCELNIKLNGLFQKRSIFPPPQWRKLTIPPPPDILYKFKLFLDNHYPPLRTVEISSVGGVWIGFGMT